MSASDEYPVRPEQILSPEPLDAADLKDRLGFTTQEFALAVGRSPRSAARWLAGESAPPISGDAAFALRRLAHLQFLLAEVISADRTSHWLRTPNPGFRGEAPLDLITSGRLEYVAAVLETLADGSPT